MKSTFVWFIFGGAILMFGGTADAWGGLFNRFSPEMLQNLGYGNHGGRYNSYINNYDNGGYTNEIDVGDDPCQYKQCFSNEDCCPAQICIYTKQYEGQCIYVMGRKLGELCRRDADCEAGLVCDSEPKGTSVCQAPIAIAKQYAEECTSSNECDISRGLCCQLQRRHRQAPRKVCSYFKDPLLCIGSVAVDQIKHEIQHTAGEKRITSGYKHYNNLNSLNNL
ncbi:ITG-like peptide [Condylostylus longicornis]|uniref:ITG-like peptide n=1 Tax=Condylostylus longicornis TaxID=2530218 RepID=UPI00244DC102|nr:ITG-like peptide [Condylostylus longicornis]